MKKEIKIYWLVPIVIVSGIFGYFSTSYKFFEIKYEIDIIALVSLIVTSAIGIYIATTLQKNIEAKKFEKELVYKIISSILQKTKNIDKFLSTNSLRFSDTVKTFKDISTLISELKEINEVCPFIDQFEATEIRTLFLEIKPLITGSPTTNNYFVLTTDHQRLSMTKINSFKKKLIKIMIETNRK